jgi:predicted AlkP superfamily phosphohydrolase/phosphomutase
VGLVGLSALLGATGTWIASRTPRGPRPLILIGIDGGEWRVVRRLWDAGRMPNLRALADAGSSASLRTAYGASPVIWTTVATGLRPGEHGITDFVLPTPKGDVPVSSTLRRAPALWNMVGQVGLRVAALGWWGSWPAEEINGVVVTDRVGSVGRDLARRVFPDSFQGTLDAWMASGAGDFPGFVRNDAVQERDLTVAVAARGLAAQRYDLLMAYFRSPDVVSHVYWKYFDPRRFPPVPAAESARHANKVPAAYEAVDQALGEILAAAGGVRNANVLVLSDHGFRAQVPERVQVQIDFDDVLARLGYLVRDRDGIDFAQTRLFTIATAHHQLVKKVRFALVGRESKGRVEAAERSAVRAALESDLARLRYRSAEPVFRTRDASPGEIASGADFVVVMSRQKATREILLDGEPVSGLVRDLHSLSGTHGPRTQGIFVAAGPDIARGAELKGISIHDVAPTVLYAMGLPYGRDFAGRPRVDLFTERFRRATPLRAVTSWGRRRVEGPTTSAADEALVEELRALGYLD